MLGQNRMGFPKANIGTSLSLDSLWCSPAKPLNIYGLKPSAVYIIKGSLQFFRVTSPSPFIDLQAPDFSMLLLPVISAGSCCFSCPLATNACFSKPALGFDRWLYSLALSLYSIWLRSLFRCTTLYCLKNSFGTIFLDQGDRRSVLHLKSLSLPRVTLP